MISIEVIKADGSEATLLVPLGMTLMECLRDAGFDEILALCGGCCSCATCHVYIEKGPDILASVSSPDEGDLLDSSDFRQFNSRLSCQINLTEMHEGIKVRIAPYSVEKLGLEVALVS